jgi:NitT/TauT family transport system permease protein
VTTLTTETQDATAPREKASAAVWPRLKPILLAIAFPLVLLALWHFATVNRPASLIPPPYDVWQELEDLAVGGINDDAYSRTLLAHLFA